MIYSMGKAVPESAPIVIETHVPIPTPGDSFDRNGPVYKAAKLMEVGNSIAVPYTRQPLASNMARATGFKFTQRKDGELLRIWRIE